MYGYELFTGDRVEVHQDEGMRMATVAKLIDSQTTLEPGYWVDVTFDGNSGLEEGIPSYILKKVDI